MNRSRLLMIGGLALAVGLLVSFSVYKRLQMSAGANPPSVEVVVAANEIQVGSKLEDRDIRLLSFPQSNIPPGAFTRKSQVLNRGVILPISPGEFILPSKLAAEFGGAGLPSMIPPGMRAVSVRVNDVVSVAGFAQPDTRVDVMATSNSGSERQTTTVLENVRVIAVGKSLTRSATGESQTAPVITLLVSPDDARKLALVSQEGRIQLALRNPLDTQKGGVGTTKEGSVYPGPTPATIDPKPKIRKAVVKVPTTSAPPPITIELIRGNKVDEKKF
jgi:pilus assembly protein CpaB